MKYLLLFFMLILAFIPQSVNAQKVLNQTETNWVNEAKAELQRALSDMDMREDERINIIERSARTLKEYGQPSAYPTGKIPLAEMMDMNFELSKRNIVELNNWWLTLKQISSEEKIKLINAMQIEIVEKQVELLLPGQGAVQLSQEAIGSVFGWNIVEGLNDGDANDARGLAEWFKTLAERKELTDKIALLINDEKESMKQINEDRTKFRITEAKLRQKYKMAEATTQTMQGYQGAKATESTNSATNTTSSYSGSEKNMTTKKVHAINVLVGTWKFGFKETGYFFWIFNNDGSFVFKDKMNENSEDRTGKYIVEGNALSIYNSDGCEKILGKYSFQIIDNQLHFNNIDDRCTERRLTLNHIWEK